MRISSAIGSGGCCGGDAEEIFDISSANVEKGRETAPGLDWRVIGAQKIEA